MATVRQGRKRAHATAPLLICRAVYHALSSGTITGHELLGPREREGSGRGLTRVVHRLARGVEAGAPGIIPQPALWQQQ